MLVTKKKPQYAMTTLYPDTTPSPSLRAQSLGGGGASTTTFTDPDRRRALDLVMRDGTRRVLTVDEVRSIHRALLAADESLTPFRGTAFANLDYASRGHVFSYDEAVAVARAIDVIWLSKPLQEAEELDRCGGRSESCACAFDVTSVGGVARNSLSYPPVYVRKNVPSASCGCK